MWLATFNWTVEMIDRIVSFVKQLFKRRRKAYSLAIVRRYTDANGSFVGEIYLLGTFAGVLGYQQIGMSLDTLPFDAKDVTAFNLDTEHDFLFPMPEGCMRVGAQDPRDNDTVRRHVARLASGGSLSLQVQNRFVEYVMERKI